MLMDMVYDLCRRAQVEDRSLYDLLREDVEIKKASFSDKELVRPRNPAIYLGLSEVMVDIVLRRVRDGER